ncbi:MAG: hypothetical protein QUV05_16790 [Phycisphaerae bacterium]|nr:hypothetical protein [Phycisphaerae bacterium]
MIFMACLIPSAQRVVILTLDFNLLRLLVLVGWIRVLRRNESVVLWWRRLDTAMLLWVISSTAIYTLRQGSLSALTNRLGMSFDAMGMYFLFRCLIRSWGDVRCIAAACALISIPVAVAFLIESQTGRNAFSVFGGVPAITVARGVHLRCQGAFSHPVLAGCFWASLMPLIGAHWWAGGKTRIWTLMGLANSAVIVFLSFSSTPLAAVAFGIVGAAFFPLRSYMRWVRWGVLLAVLILHMVMRAPVWHLLARIDLVGGSTGWHRFFLIDQTIRRFSEWWLLGTASTAHWGGNLFDVTNQYVLMCVQGGLVTLLLFVYMIACAFAGVGRLWRTSDPMTAQIMVAWSFGVCLFVHCVSFMAGSYFGQIVMIWYLLLAMIASLDPAPHRETAGTPTQKLKKPARANGRVASSRALPRGIRSA